MTGKRAAGTWIAAIVGLGLAGPSAGAATLPLDLRLTATASTLVGVVPGKAYRAVFSGTLSGTFAGEFTHVLNIEPESVWWPAAEVAWDSLLITTSRGTLTLSATSARLNRGEANDAAPWSGTATWVAEGGTGSFAGVTGRGTLSITALTNPTARRTP
jgi:hypothetical protein